MPNKIVKKEAHKKWGKELKEIRETILFFAAMPDFSKNKITSKLYKKAYKTIDNLRNYLDSIESEEHLINDSYYAPTDVSKFQEKNLEDIKETAITIDVA